MKSIKNIIIFLFLALSLNAQSPLPLDSITQKITYSGIIDVKGTKSENILKAKEWFAHYYNSANNIIQFFDENSGKIIGKSTTHFVYFLKGVGDIPMGYISYTITILSKDSKVKYIVSDFYHEGKSDCPDYGNCENMINSDSNPLTPEKQRKYNNYILEIERISRSIEKSFKEHMKTNSDW